jgi:hypothetical protein
MGEQPGLFDEPPPRSPIGLAPYHGYGDRWEFSWTCPHCGRECYGDGPTEAIEADAACCHCRAEWAGETMAVWLRKPLADHMNDKPPAGWQSRAAALRGESREGAR